MSARGQRSTRNGQSFVTEQERKLDDDALWDRYTHFAEMYRFYFDLLIKLLVFFYAAVGTYLTVFFARANVSNTRDVCTLLLPLVVGFVVAELFDHIEM